MTIRRTFRDLPEPVSDKVGVYETVVFPSEGLSVGFSQQADYEVSVCRAFNDYVTHRYRKIDPRLHPMGLIAMAWRRIIRTKSMSSPLSI